MLEETADTIYRPEQALAALWTAWVGQSIVLQHLCLVVIEEVIMNGGQTTVRILCLPPWVLGSVWNESC